MLFAEKGRGTRAFYYGPLVGAALAVTPAFAGSYQFLAAPDTALNRVYRLDTVNGEIGACQYGLKESSAVGVTLCYAPGEGAGAQAAGEYRLVASRHDKEAGVFRVNTRDGTMSICYVLNERVVCTPPGK